MLGLGAHRFACPGDQVIRLDHLDSGSYIETAGSPSKNRADGEGVSKLGCCYGSLPPAPIIYVRLDVPDALRRCLDEGVPPSVEGSIPVDFHGTPPLDRKVALPQPLSLDGRSRSFYYAEILRQVIEERAKRLRIISREDVHGFEPLELDHLQSDIFIHAPIRSFPRDLEFYDDDGPPGPSLDEDVDRIELKPGEHAQETLKPCGDEDATISLSSQCVLAREMVMTLLAHEIDRRFVITLTEALEASPNHFF